MSECISYLLSMSFLFHIILIQTMKWYIQTMEQVRTEWSRLVYQKWNNNFLRQFFIYLHILQKYIQQCYPAMLCINKFYQKILKKVVIHCYVKTGTVGHPITSFPWCHRFGQKSMKSSKWMAFFLDYHVEEKYNNGPHPSPT